MPNKVGRPKAIIDWQKVGQMCEAGCSAFGIASSLGIDDETLKKRCLVDNKCSFSEFAQQKRAKGNELLRMKQFQTAMSGNVTMQIWLGKNRLGQSEKTEIKSDIVQTMKPYTMKSLTADELLELRRLSEKMNAVEDTVTV
jgi:hypothetical protein